jgi:glycosyltransferase involved in cell wall biosynthesis
LTRTLHSERIPVLYLAPWVDYGGTAKGTLDWFKWLDRERFAPSLILTQHPSENRLLPEVLPYAEEVWNLPELMPGGEMPHFIADFVHTRGVRVVHIMNSRLGFELMPDLCCLPRHPVIVVQLHVEEHTRGGYVRYVTTRYGNLADGFSLTSRHLAKTVVDDYDVSPGKCHVIYTGVDADGEFNPDVVAPVENVASPDRTDVLFIGRLAEQKDPDLMLAVAGALRARRDDFRIHVVGYGPLEARLRRRVDELGLDAHVVFHGPAHEPAGWYAACDVVLLTSVYEGIPYVCFEAMAMGVPVVAPVLPGTAELMDAGCARLIDPRDDVTAYTDALAELMAAPDLRRALGEEGRRRIRSDYTLAKMARDHEALYDALLAAQGPVRPGMMT